MMKHLKIEIKGGPTSRNTQILLDDIDITRYLSRFEFVADAKLFNTAVLYLRNVEIDADVQALLFEHATQPKPLLEEEE